MFPCDRVPCEASKLCLKKIKNKNQFTETGNSELNLQQSVKKRQQINTQTNNLQTEQGSSVMKISKILTFTKKHPK